MILGDLNIGNGCKFFTEDSRNPNIGFKLATSDPNKSCLIIIKQYIIMHPYNTVYNICDINDYNSSKRPDSNSSQVKDCVNRICWTGNEFGSPQTILVTQHKIKSSIVVAIIEDYLVLDNKLNIFDVGPISVYNGYSEIKYRHCPNCSYKSLNQIEDANVNFDLVYKCKVCGCKIGLSTVK